MLEIFYAIACAGFGAIVWLTKPWHFVSFHKPKSAPSVSTNIDPAAGSSALTAPPAVDKQPIQLKAFQSAKAGWIKLAPAHDLLALVQADTAIDHIYIQSRLSKQVFERDLLPSLHKYAEFVQLMPASESHHHAHAGGLLTHTLEMVLATLTWRKGMFFPEGAVAEVTSAQQDEWTYVVFYAALLHDIGKVMTDLRVTWHRKDLPQPIRWMPVTGTLWELSLGHKASGEYMVGFTPKGNRDYAAHSRLAVTLLQQIAPSSALSFLAKCPPAFESLQEFLTGQDKKSLLARLISRSDQTSTAKALLEGAKSRFPTATSVPLVELLMDAIRSMLKHGTELPLNRSGAAGWVYDGSIWFVAKRLSDAVRAHIKKHAPDEIIPGEAKNDRLFDTWQEYGCIMPNPGTGQAIWHVDVNGSVNPKGIKNETGSGATDGNYTHSLSMLRFPLQKIFDSESLYPLPMVGQILVRNGRKVEAIDESTAMSQDRMASPEPVADAPAEKVNNQEVEALLPAVEDDKAIATLLVQSNKPNEPLIDSGRVPPLSGMADVYSASRSLKTTALSIRAPSFNLPKTAATRPTSIGTQKSTNDSTSTASRHKLKQSGAPRTASSAPPQSAPHSNEYDVESMSVGGVDGFDVDLADPITVASKTVSSAASPLPAAIVPTKSIPSTSGDQTSSAVRLKRAATPTATAPVLMQPRLPKDGDGGVHLINKRPTKEPSPTCVEFIHWIQEEIAHHLMTYNQSNSMVHFVPEGVALVSPAIFRSYLKSQSNDVNDVITEADVKQLQKELTDADLHLRHENSNIVFYEVAKKGGLKLSRLACIVLMDADKYFAPVPPINQVLTRK
jgi:integrating conjugative element relaxase (TIGR03760 family)